MKKSLKNLTLILLLIILSACSSDDNVNTENEAPPFLTEAGNDILNIEEFEIALGAEALKSNESGVWSLYSGLVDEKVYFEDVKNPKTIFHGLPDEEYKLVWSVLRAGKFASDTVTVTFAPLKTEIINISPEFYKSRLLLQAKYYDKGEWTFEGDYHSFYPFYYNSGWEDKNSPEIRFYGLENKTCKLTWTTWYGSKSASETIEFKAGAYQQDEALEDLNAGNWQYIKDENGNVIELNMQADNRAWIFRDMSLFPALQSLVHLKKLNLSGDGFYTFPPVITSKYLDLEVLNFSNNAISSIPENFGNLTKLDTLKINNNQDSKVLNALPDSFGNLTKLRYLDLNGMGISHMPESFSNLISLNYLELQGNEITKLPENFGNLKNLETFRGPGLLQNIPNSFSNLENLKFCFFFINSGNAVLPDDFGNLKKLETLWLFGNYQNLPDSFADLISLKDLEITGGSVINELPDNFGNLINLEKVRIAGNFKVLPNSFSNLSNLKSLELYGILEYLPVDFGNLKNLEWLSINSMNLKEIPDSFGGLESLKTFRAYQNDISVIPDSFGNLPNITAVDLSYNYISQFPSTISNLSDTLLDLTIRGNDYSQDKLKSLEEMLPTTRIITD
ncbi:leucine-rich repeat protein [Aestuariibaculum sp. YM273]|uniref:leucine-rich repeat domain-containing protein n=1 Tax=Aestuariibaculum sp. YM273 TaxID=3070659 RepID=UPI0027DBFFE4|nr:leucine-rich repeat protein [Aestuariibaculum sp. YM273]WMI65078.1 leucine-rich repeat protein [Aestuariibaculum sp. YM273]